MKNNTKKNKQKKLRSIKFEPGPLQSPCILSRVPLAMFIALLLWQPLRNVAATLSAHYSVDALEVSMVTGMASRDCEGQSEPINGTMLRDRRNKKTAIKITNHASCHFYSCFAKKCLCVLCLVVFSPPFLVYHGLTVYASLDDCCQFIGCTGEEKNTNALFSLFLRHWLTFNNDVAVTLQSKSFKWNLMWNSLMKYYFMGL